MASEKSKEIPTEKLGDLSLEKSGGMFFFNVEHHLSYHKIILQVKKYVFVVRYNL